MLIAIPSKGRAGITTSQNILPNATWFIPESEEHQYKGIYKNVISVPINVKGITATRNWILKNTNENWVVFIDDDVKSAGYIKLNDRSGKNIKIENEKFWLNEFQKYFELTEQLNYKIWGVKTEAALRSVYPYKPINMRSYITASCMGIINHGEYYFDESYKVKEDYEICLRHLIDKKGILTIRYLHWENEHWQKDGGCKDYRTIEMEREAIKKLINQYPGMIKSAKRKANEFTIMLNI